MWGKVCLIEDHIICNQRTRVLALILSKLFQLPAFGWLIYCINSFVFEAEIAILGILTLLVSISNSCIVQGLTIYKQMYHPQLLWWRGEYLTFDDRNFSLLSMHIYRQLNIDKIIWLHTRIFSKTSKVLFDGIWKKKDHLKLSCINSCL